MGDGGAAQPAGAVASAAAAAGVPGEGGHDVRPTEGHPVATAGATARTSESESSSSSSSSTSRDGAGRRFSFLEDQEHQRRKDAAAKAEQESNSYVAGWRDYLLFAYFCVNVMIIGNPLLNSNAVLRKWHSMDAFRGECDADGEMLDWCPQQAAAARSALLLFQSILWGMAMAGGVLVDTFTASMCLLVAHLMYAGGAHFLKSHVTRQIFLGCALQAASGELLLNSVLPICGLFTKHQYVMLLIVTLCSDLSVLTYPLVETFLAPRSPISAVSEDFWHGVYEIMMWASLGAAFIGTFLLPVDDNGGLMPVTKAAAGLAGSPRRHGADLIKGSVETLLGAHGHRREGSGRLSDEEDWVDEGDDSEAGDRSAGGATGNAAGGGAGGSAADGADGAAGPLAAAIGGSPRAASPRAASRVSPRKPASPRPPRDGPLDPAAAAAAHARAAAAVAAAAAAAAAADRSILLSQAEEDEFRAAAFYAAEEAFDEGDLLTCAAALRRERTGARVDENGNVLLWRLNLVDKMKTVQFWLILGTYVFTTIRVSFYLNHNKAILETAGDSGQLANRFMWILALGSLFGPLAWLMNDTYAPVVCLAVLAGLSLATNVLAAFDSLTAQLAAMLCLASCRSFLLPTTLSYVANVFGLNHFPVLSVLIGLAGTFCNFVNHFFDQQVERSFEGDARITNYIMIVLGVICAALVVVQYFSPTLTEDPDKEKDDE